MVAPIKVCPIQLPGRGQRWREPAFTELTVAAAALVDALLPYLDKPWALFGHSMGATLAFELARQLRRKGGPQPRGLFLSGRAAPQLGQRETPFYDAPTEQFFGHLRRLKGTPPEVLEHAELMEMMLPTLRADFQMIQSYVYGPEPPLDCPLTVFGGWEDEHATPATLAAWREQTAGRFQQRMFPGGHFFLQTARPALLAALSEELTLLIKESFW